MAAYGALVSLMNTIEQIQHNPRCPISLDKEQVESLTEKVTKLQEFLEGYSHVGYSKDADALESRIADSAYAVEDVIETHIADRILAGSTGDHDEKISSVDFYEGLQKVIQDMDSITKEVMEIKEKKGVADQLLRNSRPASSFRSSSTQQNTMVGFDDACLELMDKLTGQPSGGLQIIQIVGMGGMGKTTLARNIYAKPLVKGYFYISAWATISQEYNTQEILREVLSQVLSRENEDGDDLSEISGKDDLSEISDYELGDRLYKHLSGRRYLIVMDDIWEIEVWDQLKFFFPDYNNGSRIVVTTRLSNLAFQTHSYSLEMKFLQEDNSWNLFSKTVFEEEGCPRELEEIGKKIVNNCKGLPLSIVVIRGLLTKSERTRKYWEYVLENLNSIVNLDDNERCLQILYMSYHNLPVHLKPCFLYMGVFKEDSRIHASELVKLWSAEGFLRPLGDRSLKDAAGVSIPHSSKEKRSLEKATEYLQELVDRNLILVEERNYNGKVKYCKIHDLLRDLCLREARKGEFLCVMGEQSNIPQNTNMERRISIKSIADVKYPPEIHFLPVVRSLIWQHSVCDFPSFFCRLLRVYLGIFEPFSYSREYSGEYIFQQFNLRYVALTESLCGSLWYSSSNLLLPLWNLQTLILEGTYMEFILEIWKMHQLRYAKVKYIQLPDPPTDDIVILENLQVLAVVVDFKCGEELVKRIPNLKKLKVKYWSESLDNYCINNLGHLNALESLGIFFLGQGHLLKYLTIPQNLKKLTLKGYGNCNWEDILEKIGSLPLLEKLKLKRGSFEGGKWETVEGQFPSLKFLLVESLSDLEYWTVESFHFPRLLHLVLCGLRKLKKIPSEIIEIPTLQSIQLRDCSMSAYESAKRILKEQDKLYGEVRLQLILNGFVFDINKYKIYDKDIDEDENNDEDEAEDGVHEGEDEDDEDENGDEDEAQDGVHEGEGEDDEDENGDENEDEDGVPEVEDEDDEDEDGVREDEDDDNENDDEDEDEDGVPEGEDEDEKWYESDMSIL